MPEIPTLLVATSRTTKYEVQPHDGVATLGRDQSATIHIPDSRISRRHLLLEPRADGWHAVDTSSNGTYLDGEPIEDILITGTTRVNLGDPEGIPVHIDLAQDSSAPPAISPDTTDVAGSAELLDEDDDLHDDADETDPIIARVGSQVAARREELGLTQRKLARDGVIAAGVLIALEKGRRWPRAKTLSKLEPALGWPDGRLNEMRDEAAASLSTTVEAPLLASAIELHLSTLTAAIDRLPDVQAPDYTPLVTAILTDLRNVERLVADAARTAKGTPAIARTLGRVRQMYGDLMTKAARSPAATLGQRLYATRSATGLTAEEAANAAGVAASAVLELEAGGDVDPVVAAALSRLVSDLNRPDGTGLSR
ncbi:MULTISPECIES: FHA domain-containing protein [Mycobacteriaceae]|uniref:FHA domain-containing protein n=1 Tax=Mycobacteriaceae TaxID=1762 RepID=UPI001CF55F17|nr:MULTISPECIES: FHA domain-containing protein [Mycobacteriaceae]UCN12721.1 FHA domain-containing protein [Mycobacterium intracellulare subsp. chimaera]